MSTRRIPSLVPYSIVLRCRYYVPTIPIASHPPVIGRGNKMQGPKRLQEGSVRGYEVHGGGDHHRRPRRGHPFRGAGTVGRAGARLRGDAIGGTCVLGLARVVD